MFAFLYETLDKCFTLESQLDDFFARFFTRLLNGQAWTTSDTIINRNFQETPSQTCSRQFEEVLPAAPTLHLPNGAYMQVDDALTELEASDYREWVQSSVSS
jgi:hypothetical protein